MFYQLKNFLIIGTTELGVRITSEVVPNGVRTIFEAAVELMELRSIETGIICIFENSRKNSMSKM